MLKLICVGKLKENYLKEAFNEYLKRISKYSKIDVIEISDESINDDSTTSINKAIEIESNKILSKIDPKEYVILLYINGDSIDSIELSNKISSLLDKGEKITLVIGGSYGVNQNVVNRANYKLSFSKLTFPHQLFRVMLLEQLYRSFKIINKEKYHK